MEKRRRLCVVYEKYGETFKAFTYFANIFFMANRVSDTLQAKKKPAETS